MQIGARVGAGEVKIFPTRWRGAASGRATKAAS
jgi:hypothetical protein